VPSPYRRTARPPELLARHIFWNRCTYCRATGRSRLWPRIRTVLPSRAKTQVYLLSAWKLRTWTLPSPVHLLARIQRSGCGRASNCRASCASSADSSAAGRGCAICASSFSTARRTACKRRERTPRRRRRTDRLPQAARTLRFFILVLMRSCFSGERYSTNILPCR
jgi:hypothetical protein